MASFGGGRPPKFDPKDMPVKEVEFVETEFGLDSETYCRIKSHVWSEVSQKAKEDGWAQAREEAKKSIKQELREELTKELMPDLVAKAEAKALDQAVKKAKEELEPKLRTEAVERFKEDWKKEVLTDDDRKAFAAALRDIEVESLTYATSASKEADEHGTGFHWSKRVRHALLAAALIGLGPYALWLVGTRDWHSVTFWLAALPYIVVLSYCATMAYLAPSNVDKYGDRKKTTADQLRKLSSDYLQIVSQARLVRHLHLATKIRRDVQAEFDSLAKRKVALDEQYQPSVDLVEGVKPQVKLRLSEEIDPEKIYAEEFEEQLKGKRAS
jgi:hypothetical protein